MVKLKWDNSYSVNNKQIDDQHKALFQLVNDLDQSIEEKKEEQVIGKILNDLASYFFTHFRTEEGILEEYGYPELDRHRKEHLGFTKKMMSYRHDFKEGDFSRAKGMVKYLSNWVVHHTKGIDMKYASFFTAKGLKH